MGVVGDDRTTAVPPVVGKPHVPLVQMAQVFNHDRNTAHRGVGAQVHWLIEHKHHLSGDVSVVPLVGCPFREARHGSGDAVNWIGEESEFSADIHVAHPWVSPVEALIEADNTFGIAFAVMNLAVPQPFEVTRIAGFKIRQSAIGIPHVESQSPDILNQHIGRHRNGGFRRLFKQIQIDLYGFDIHRR